ncbi:MAG: hypothetical protein K2M91_11460 [Lachnospiraceae bacterium]|nr:hypothetical protein [Lachnospiraceae bacterium]
MDLDDLLNDILDEFLLECVCDKIEDVSELPKMLKGINYLDRKQEIITQTTRCEIIDGDDAFIENYFVSGNEIQIQYELTYILQTLINTKAIWRVQGCAQIELLIPDTDSADWAVFDNVQTKDFSAYYEKYKGLVRFRDIVYQDVECDAVHC